MLSIRENGAYNCHGIKAHLLLELIAYIRDNIHMNLNLLYDYLAVDSLPSTYYINKFAKISFLNFLLIFDWTDIRILLIVRVHYIHTNCQL